MARIDNLTLTLEEIESRFDSAQGVSEAQVHEYIQRWLTNQLLYQEAVRRGLDQTEDIESRLADFRRQLAINALLEEEIYAITTQEGSDEEVRKYYDSHQDEFILSQDVALLSFIIVRDRETANAFRSNLLRGTSWGAARNELLAHPQQRDAVLTAMDSVYLTAQTMVPSDLWRVVVSSPRQEPTFPVQSEHGYHVLTVWKLKRRGEVADLPYVRQEIESRLTIARRQRAMEQLLATLRSQHVVQIFVSSVPQDSVSLLKKE